MTIDLSQFVGKKVTVTFRSGKKITDVLFFNENVVWPYKFWGHSYQKEGNEDYSQSPYDIIHIELAEEPMKKYEQLEAQIVKLQEEVERLKKQEKEEEQKDKLPYHFSRETCLSFLKNTKLLGLLCGAFNWQSTPQGTTHWGDIFYNGKPLTDADIIQIQKWVIMSFEQEFGK